MIRLFRRTEPLLMPAAVARRVQAWRGPAMQPYARFGFLQRHGWAGWLILLFLGAGYGALFASGFPDDLALLVAPFGLLGLVIIWLLPATDHAPTRLLTAMLFVFLYALLCWPDYLALTLPGLPWITVIRLVGVPMMLTLLIAFSISPTLRRQTMDTLNAMPLVWRGYLLFMATGALSLIFSKSMSGSISRYMVAQMAWTTPFLVACIIFRRPGLAMRFVYSLWAIVLVVCAIGVLEAHRKGVLWAGHIPSFLAIQDENVQRFLAGTERAASGKYRAQSKFTTSLGFAEFLALATPFILHLIATSRRWLVRGGGAATVLLIVYCLIKTDSRLGMLGFLLSLLAFVLIWALRLFRKDRHSLLARIVIAAYPVMFLAGIVSAFTVPQIKYHVFGGGAAQYSTESRKEQIRRGIPMVLAQPLGHGVGMGADTLGFVLQDGTLTIDTYYLSVALEYGVIGFIAYYGMFIAAMVYLGRQLMYAHDEETELIGPLLISFGVFFVIKSVFSQQENHPLVFIMLGLSCALVERIQRERAWQQRSADLRSVVSERRGNKTFSYTNQSG